MKNHIFHKIRDFNEIKFHTLHEFSRISHVLYFMNLTCFIYFMDFMNL